MVGIGIVAFAMMGPEEPIPSTPKIKKGISLPAGNFVWFIVMNYSLAVTLTP